MSDEIVEDAVTAKTGKASASRDVIKVGSKVSSSSRSEKGMSSMADRIRG